MKLVSLLFIILLLSNNVDAAQFVENFETPGRVDYTTSTGVWNFVLRYIVPPPVYDYTASAGGDNENAPLDFGSGSDGEFDLSEYARFSINGDISGNTVTVDTNVHPILNITNFNLRPGWVLRGSGSSPLWIKVLGHVTIDGTIDCSGTAGEASSSAHTTIARGGTGRCAGAAGGEGGVTGTIPGGGGSAFGVMVTGGGHGTTNGGVPGGGGGGGGFNTGAGGSANGTGTGPGTGGLSSDDPHILFFSIATGGPGGGSGGGGGGALTGSTRGGGGGAGGGVIRITAGGNISISASGSILAKGGNGGSGAGGAGGGGGGAGGTIWLSTPNTITSRGNIDSLEGTGGTGAGNGGSGCTGRTWIVAGGGYNPIGVSEQPIANLGNFGEVHFSKQPFVVQSLPYDTRSSKPTYNSFSFYGIAGTPSAVTLLISGSNDGFVSDDTGWVAQSHVDALAGKRFFRIKFSMQYAGPAQNSPITIPLSITKVIVDYNTSPQSLFEVTPSCGTFGSPGEFLFVIVACGFGGFLTTGRLRIRNRRLHTTTLLSK